MTGQPESDEVATETGGCPDDILDPVVADAAARAGMSTNEVRVVSATEAQWPDGGLGCPQPGMRYTQALVDGYRIIVRVGDRELDYRVRGPGRFRICE